MLPFTAAVSRSLPPREERTAFSLFFFSLARPSPPSLSFCACICNKLSKLHPLVRSPPAPFLLHHGRKVFFLHVLSSSCWRWRHREEKMKPSQERPRSYATARHSLSPVGGSASIQSASSTIPHPPPSSARRQCSSEGLPAPPAAHPSRPSTSSHTV